MSDRSCNRCVFDELQRQAEKRGETAILIKDQEGGFPMGRRVMYRRADGTQYDGEHWFAEVSKSCHC